MKILGRQSQNVEDRRWDTSWQAPHRNPNSLPAVVNATRSSEVKAQQQMDASRAKDVPKTSDFSPMLKDMTKKNMTEGAMKPSVPIPTPRPDPNSPPIPSTYKYPDKGNV